MQKIKHPHEFEVVEEEKKEKKKSLWLNYVLSYLLNTFKRNIIY